MALVRYALPPAEPPALTDCRFYHSIELPGIGLQQGYWDLRGGYDDYFGGQDFSGERMLDIGTSSGALAFEIERRGASEVVAFDLDEGLTYDRRLPTAETVLTKFRAGIALVSEGQRRIAVIVEPAHPARIGPLLMSAYGLTDREQDVTRLVLQGESTAAIADRLVVSVHTVNSTSRASSKDRRAQPPRPRGQGLLLLLRTTATRQRVAGDTAQAAPRRPDGPPLISAALEAALRAPYIPRATLGRMEDLGQIAAVVIACGTALVFALMAWAGQHQS